MPIGLTERLKTRKSIGFETFKIAKLAVYLAIINEVSVVVLCQWSVSHIKFSMFTFWKPW